MDTSGREVLGQLGVRLAFDLATSPVFGAAREIVRAATENPSRFSGAIGRVPGAYVDAAVADHEPGELVGMPVSVLRGVGQGLQAGMREALEVHTVADLADYPPFVEASALLDRVVQDEHGWEPDPGTPPDLLPGGQDTPTDVAYYAVPLIFGDEETEPSTAELLEEVRTLARSSEAELSPRRGESLLSALSRNQELVEPVDVTSLPPQVATAPRLGALLRFEQAWHRQGLGLGQLLHSVALAPGESTHIAVIDWSRRESGAVAEEDEQREALRARTSQQRSITETTSAVAREVQHGFSDIHLYAESDQYGESGGHLAGGYSYGDGRTVAHAHSTSVSVGTRAVSAENAQRISQATQQAASSSRARRASVVREVAQSEQERISTRTITNYNHMHALTVQYHEVLQTYRTTLRLVEVDRLLYIPVKPLDFSDPQLLARFRHVLGAAALDAHTRALLLGVGDEPTVAFEAQRAWTAEPAAEEADRHERRRRVRRRAQSRARWRGSLAAARVAGALVDASSEPDTWSMLGSTRLTGATWPDGGVENVTIRTRTGAAIDVATAGQVLEPGVVLDDVTSVRIERHPDGGSVSGAVQEFALDFETETGRKFQLHLDFVWTGTSLGLLTVEEPERRGEVLPRLQANAMHYSAAVWASLSPQEFLGAIGNSRWRGTPIAANIDARPVAISGNQVGFRWHGPVDKQYLAWEALQRTTPSTSQLMSMPTGGVFGEAVLGRATSAERLDLTRFWNWQDSPIPFRAPEIASIQSGSRAQAVDLAPSGFAQALVQLQQLGQLPDPQGLGAVLTALASADMFRNMSGLTETIGLVRAMGDAVTSGAASASRQAGANFATGANAQLELLRLVPSLVSTAMGVPMAPPGPGMSNISNAGAALNEGRRLDAGSLNGGSAASPSARPVSPAPSPQPASIPTTSDPTLARSSWSGSASASVPRPPAPSTAVGTATPAPPGLPTGSTNAGTAFEAIIGAGTSQPRMSPSPDTTSARTSPQFLPDIPVDLTPAPGTVSSITPATSPVQERMLEALRATVDASGVDADRAGDVLREWYREGVKPLLQHAWVVDRFATSALRQGFDWMGNAAVLGLSDVTDETHAEALALMEDCLRSAIRRAGMRMTETGDPDFLLDVVRWVEYAQFIDVTSLTLDDAVAMTPLRVVIEDLRMSGAPDAGEQAEVSVVARVRVADGPPLATILKVDVGADGGHIDPPSGTANHSGEFVTRVSRNDSGENLVVTATTSFAPLAPFSQVVLTDTRSLTVD